MFGPWAIVAEIGIAIAIHYLNEWLSDPPPDNRPKQFADVPTTTAGTPLPIVFGRFRLRRPSLLWYGGYRIFTRGQLHGYPESASTPPLWYGLNMLFGLGIPHAPIGVSTKIKLTRIFVGDGPDDDLGITLADTQVRVCEWSSSKSFWKWAEGKIQFFAGSSGQVLSNNAGPALPDDDVTEVARFMRRNGIDPTLIPGYRNQLLVAFTGNHDRLLDHLPGGGQNPDNVLSAFVFGPTNALPPISFELSTRTAVFAPTYANGETTTTGDANPAEVIYQILTSTWSCMGVDPDKIDMTSFTAAATTLFEEDHGYSNVIDTQRAGKDVLQEVINQINGALYEDPATGSVHLNLIRNDYDPAAIPSFDDRHVIELERWFPGEWTDTINRVSVKFTNRDAGYTEDTATALNQASAVMQDAAVTGGKTRIASVEYPGCCTLKLAKQLAARDLNVLSQPIGQLRIVLNRLIDLHGTSNAAQLRPGAVFKLSIAEPSWPGGKLIDSVVFRVTKVDPGQLGDRRVTIDAITDVFRAGAVALDNDPSILFLPRPCPLLHRYFTEAPRWIQNYLTSTGVLPNADVQRVMALAHPSDSSQTFEALTAKVAGVAVLPEQEDVPGDSFPPSATVATTYAKEKAPYDNVTGLVVTNFYPSDSAAAAVLGSASFDDITNSGVNLFVAGDEIMAYESATDLGGSPKQWRLNNVWRALLDTSPHDHPVGERVYFLVSGDFLGGYVGRRGWSA